MKYKLTDLQKLMLMQSGLIRDICKPLFDESGLNNYVFMEINAKGELVYLNSSENYFNELISKEIISEMPNKIINPYIKKGFHLEASQSKYIDQVFKGGIDNINEQYQLGNFLFVVNTVERDGQPVAQISRFATDVDNKGVNDYYLNKLDKIVEFCHYFPVRMDAFFKQNKKLNYDRAAEEIENRIISLKQAKSELSKDESLVFYMKSSQYPYKRKLVELTPVERSIIRLSLKGYTADMIGRQIFMSRRTVEKYFATIKDKLECKYKLHIIGRLHELGVLDRI